MANTTRPLTQNEFEYIYNEFEYRNDTRMMIIVGLMAQCLRIGDILSLSIKDMYTPNGIPRDKFDIVEGKTKKLRTVFIGEKMQQLLITHYPTIKNKKGGYMFYSTKRPQAPLTQQGVRFILSYFTDSARGQNQIEQVSPHSFRKYGARKMYENGTPVGTICKYLNHSSESVTYRYICITPQDIQQAVQCLVF